MVPTSGPTKAWLHCLGEGTPNEGIKFACGTEVPDAGLVKLQFGWLIVIDSALNAL
jgi:hypothetical protein